MNCGNTEAGQWGGIHINGNAVLNDRNETLVGIIGNYGKTVNGNDDENSATISYLRIQYAGAMQRNIGGALNLNGAGSGTFSIIYRYTKVPAMDLDCEEGPFPLERS